MKSTIFRILVWLVVVASITDAVAGAPAGEAGHERPRVGLVLGGGGARGAAHIGVLKELERQRIPIDAIAGTSMGAIVGGLYASGMTPAELETLVNSIDWADAFVDSPDRESLSYRRKQDDAAYPVRLELGLSDGDLLIPKGLIQGQRLQVILREQLLDIRTEDFDELPTSFRAVASDIATGEAYVMSKGDLALALRASMSAPGIFAPVTVDGRTLVDGGLVGNLPIDVMQQMDVDVIIAVDVEFPLYQPEELQSALGIAEQMLTILIRKETQRQVAALDENDVLIRPTLGQYPSTNFAQIAEVIEPGMLATAAESGRLEYLALSREEYNQFLTARTATRTAADTVDFVRIVDRGPLSADAIAARLSTRAGDELDLDVLADDVARLYGLNYYEHVGYRLVKENGRTGVEFNTRAKSWGPNFLRFGLSLEDDLEGSTAFNVSARLTATGMNSLGAEWRNDLALGTNPKFESEFYQPLDFDSRYFVAPRLRLEQSNFNAFSGDDAVARFRVSEMEAGFDFGRSLGQWGEWRTGIFRGQGNARVRIGDVAIPDIDFDRGGVVARFAVDTLDNARIARDGVLANIEWLMSRPGFGADFSYDTLSANVEKVWSWGEGESHTMALAMEYATTAQSDDLVQDFFQLGGFLRLSGLAVGEISGPHTALARAVYYRRVGGTPVTPFYVGGSLETGNAWQDRADMSFDSLLVNGSLFAALDTFLGPLFLAAGFSDEGDSSFYLFFGNPRRGRSD